ncbi:hypothetical protein ACFOSC_04750 [Streptantibioticus rubrisoli]|uniref:DUF8017 domain-containing protein n=1 Tax=Streptantibioticus rubrisoli TaxID=1387313 RepID=A0ABT1PE70_9ACTN|nr:hypothetical protein [Streptantibioticus rubrisoli]MCQ4043675.1 hypothetical protein [Streptantibioticus rubrisoli]
MSWPQNPHDAQDPQQQPQQPQQGFGPAPAWTPTGEMPRIQPPGPPGPPTPPAQPPQQPQAQPPYAQPAQPPQGPPPLGFPQHAPAPQGQPPFTPPEPEAARPARNRKTLLTVVGAVVALAVIGGGVAFAMKGGGAKPKVSKPTHAPTVAAPTPTEQGPNSSGNGSDAKPMIAGWQTQVWQHHGFTYDVPPASDHWSVDKPDLENAYTDQNGKPMLGMTGVSYYRQGGCASSGSTTGPIQAGKGQLATIGSQGDRGNTLQDSAKIAANNWLFGAYGGLDGHKPKVTVNQVTPWKHNGIDGYLATATATNIYRPSPCVPATATSRAIAMRLKDGTTGIWILYADQGVPNALTSDEIDKIMGTVRPASAN